MGGPLLKRGVPNLPNLKILLAIILPILENFEKLSGAKRPETAPKAPFRKFFRIFGKIGS